MADREKIIKTLECCKEKTCDYSNPKNVCPYLKWCGEYEDSCYDCTTRLATDVLELLKPRLLTLEEAYAEEIVWYESRCVYDSAWGKLSPGDTKVSTAITRLGHNGWAYEDDRDYGSAWRCWSKRPSDEQRKAIPWGD